MDIPENHQKKIVFWGTPEFALPTLKQLIEDRWDIAAVVTAPDVRARRHHEFHPSPVKIEALRHNIPVLEPEHLKDSRLRTSLEELQPDLFFVAAYGKIIPEDILSIPRNGSLNLHPSLLPRWRGPSPIQKSIIEGDKETGISIIRMDKEMDHGPILFQKSILLDVKETGKTLHDTLACLGAEAAGETLTHWFQDEITPQPQNHSEATFSKILTREDGKIAWQDSAPALERQIRAYNLWPESYCLWQRRENILRLKIEEADMITQNKEWTPGKTWMPTSHTLAVETNSGSLLLQRIQPEGKASMSIKEFINGHRDVIGAILI